MSWNRPTLQTLIDRNLADIASRLTGTVTYLRRTVLGVLAKMHAGAMHCLYGLLAWLMKQLFPDTAEGAYLDRWCAVWDITRTSATSASGQLTITGTDGSTIPAGTVWQRADGAEYTTDAEAVIADGEALVAITASSAGTDGNADAATTLTLVSPIAGVQSTATSGAITGGADEETDASLLARLLARIRQAPHGGAEFDYVTWAQKVIGADNPVWVAKHEMGVGTVTVRCMTYGDTDDGVPDAVTVDSLQEYMDENAPVIGDTFVFAPIAAPLNPVINVSPNTEAVKTAITAELQDLLEREAEPGATLLISHIREAISTASGESDHELVSPVANVTHTTGYIPTLGEITWGDIA